MGLRRGGVVGAVPRSRGGVLERVSLKRRMGLGVVLLGVVVVGEAVLGPVCGFVEGCGRRYASSSPSVTVCLTLSGGCCDADPAVVIGRG